MITYFTSNKSNFQVELRTFHCPPHYKVYESYNPVGPKGTPEVDVYVKVYYDPADPDEFYSPDPFETVVAKICDQIKKEV